MLKFYILVSRSIPRVLRHTEMIPKNKLVYIINTLDKSFEKECSSTLKSMNIEYYVTESNGTPAKGKNELLRIFEESDNDYCVQVDGDDYLTPYGVYLYERISKLPHAPDAICLTEQVALCLNEAELKKGNHVAEKRNLFKKQEHNYESYKKSLIKNKFSKPEIKKIIKNHKQYYKNAHKYVQSEEAHCRVVFFSKKAAAIKFPEGLNIGEDTLHFFLLKNEAFKGNLRFIYNPEKPATYIYDQTDGKGTVIQHLLDRDWQWMENFNNYVSRYKEEGLLHEGNLPRLSLDYEKDEIFDDYDFAGLSKYRFSDNIHIVAPANCNKNTIEKLYNREITIAMKNNS